MKYIEAKGDSIDAAVESALLQLGMSRDDVSVEVIQQPKSGFLGFGKEPAIVRVSYEVTPTGRAVEFLQGLLIRFGTPADIRAEENVEERTISLTLTGDNMNAVDFMTEKLREHGFTGNTTVMPFEPVCGCHVGPGSVALFFWGEKKL